MKLINCLIIIFLNYQLFLLLSKKIYKNSIYIFIPVMLFISFNLFFSELTLKITFLILLYSLALPILYFMSKLINVTNNKNEISENIKDNFLKVKSIMVNYILPIMITLFQILVICIKELQDEF